MRIDRFLFGEGLVKRSTINIKLYVMSKDSEKLKEVYGETLDLITPSGHKVSIRQQTGEDDDIISNAKGVLDGTSSNKFIAGIVVNTDITENGKFNLDTARELKLCDKYFIMIASRIFSIGQSLKFSYKWPDDLEVDYEEDLGLYIWDYYDEEKPFPEKGNPDYFEFRIPPHQFGKDKLREIKLDSGKILRYKFVDGHGERFLMNLTEDQQTINAELLARNLEYKMSENWVRVQNFKTFTSLDMMQIRKDVTENDPTTPMISELEHPVTGQKIDYPVVGAPDFFFPRKA